VKRRSFCGNALLGYAAAIGGVISNSSFAQQSSRNNRPNILFILTDDQRWDTLGCAGNPIIHTPVMDSMAKNGVRFENAFVTSPACAPCRATLLTGLYERTHNYTFGKQGLRKTYTDASFPIHLRRAGYRTGLIGKWDTKTEDPDARNKMFDFEYINRWPYLKEINGRKIHLTELFGEKAIQFIKESTPERPFYLSLFFHAPHAENYDPEQFYWPPACDGLYEDVSIPEPKTFDEVFFNTQPQYLQNHFDRVDRWFRRFDTAEKYQKMVKGYYRMITGADMVIGRVIKELENKGIADNTVIIFMGDNGFFLGERGFGGKFLLYEPALRVPLIIVDPRLNSSRRNLVLPHQALSLDIAPTILDLAGVPVPDYMQGESLMPLVNGDSVDWRSEFFIEYDCKEFQTIRTEGYRTERWKYIRYMDYSDSEELYDLANDPWEEKNLAHEQKYNEQLLEIRRKCNQMIIKLLEEKK